MSKLIILEQYKLAIFLIEKVANTSISLAFRSLAPIPKRQPSLTDLDGWEGFLRVAFVRDPLTRIASTYNSKLVGDNRFRQPMGMTADMPFELFVEMVHDKADEELDRHLWPQSKRLWDERYGLLPNKLLRFEAIMSEWEVLRELVPGLGPLPHCNPAPLVAKHSERTVALTRARYARDFELLGY